MNAKNLWADDVARGQSDMVGNCPVLKSWKLRWRVWTVCIAQAAVSEAAWGVHWKTRALVYHDSGQCMPDSLKSGGMLQTTQEQLFSSQDNAGEPVQQKKTRQFRMLKVPGWLLELCRSRLSMYDYWLACSHHTESQTTARESNIPPQDHFTSDAFPATTLPIYPDLGLAHSTLDCTLRGLATPGLS